ncbi:MAG: UDP-glucose 4-epimerase [Alphaproteobacteria bacterium TMED62]|nr:MAG: UDP-glucose 4-epimerase [Alphaproteobacteria bacterium TMED62]
MQNKNIKKVLITGGAGYVGNILVPLLLANHYKIIVYDTLFFYEDTLKKDKNLKIVKGDIRDIELFKTNLENVDAVIHMACISNDPSFELNPDLATSINYTCFEPLVVAAKKAGVKRFIYCSSSSVYGVSESPNVTESHPLVPLTQYNKYKALCEPILFKYQEKDFTCVTLRPATICGYSPRCRLDLTVNILTNHAFNNNKIIVFGGNQKRPNLHVKDMAEAYKLFLEAPIEKISGEIFNIGYQNYSVNEIANIVKNSLEKFENRNNIVIEKISSDDDRSYQINSDKIFNVLGYKPKRTLEDAVYDLCQAFKQGKLPDSLNAKKYINVKTMKSKNIE